MPTARLKTSPARGQSRARRLLAALAWAALLASSAASAAQQPLPPALEKTFAGGVAALNAGDLDAAERAFLEVLKARGGAGASVRHNLGIVYQRRGAHAKAVAEFRAASRLEPRYGPARLLSGSSLLALGRPVEAARELEVAARLMPDEPQAHLLLAGAYERNDDWLGAADAYRRLRELQPQEAEHAYRLGRAYAKLAEWSQRRIGQISPRSARLQQTLGHHYRAQGKADEAIAAFRRAAAADPKLPEVHLLLALLHAERKDFDAALKEVELELKLVPESRGALELKRRIEAARAASP
jgi:tetratricopeptide (TPR) repeat protein